MVEKEHIENYYKIRKLTGGDPEFPHCKTREESKKFYTNEAIKNFNSFSKYLESSIDGAYCEGYNNVLEACANVLSADEYYKVVSWLDEHNL